MPLIGASADGSKRLRPGLCPIGLVVKEAQSVAEHNPDPRPERAAFSIDPGIYLSSQFGPRLQDAVIDRRMGLKALSSVSRDMFVEATV